MRSFKFTSPAGPVLEFSAAKPYVFSRLRGAGYVEAVHYGVQAAGQHGETTVDVLYGPREMELEGYVHGMTRQELRGNLRALNKALALQDTPHAFEYTNEYGAYTINGYATAPLDEADLLKPSGQLYLPVTITLFCADPFWRPADMTEELTIGYRVGRFKFPFKISGNGVTFGAGGYKDTVANIGDVYAPVDITVNGPAVNPSIFNATTGKRVTLERIIQACEVLHINTTPGGEVVEIQNILTGEAVEAWQFLNVNDEDFDMWRLKPGANVVSYDSGNDETGALVKMSWVSPLAGV